jgi:hypothetical protein
MLDTSVFYRLTNKFLGQGKSLDVVPDGSGLLKMEVTGDHNGQFWRLVARSDGKYALQTAYLGECFSLDVINDGINTTPCLATTGYRSGQLWTLNPRADGTYRLTSDFSGPDVSLDTYGDTHEPYLNTGDHTGQHWTLTKAGPVTRTVPIPALNLKGGNLDKTEGWGDGVLVYTVDATIESGASPVVVIPKQVSNSDDYGHLYQAPYGVGDVAHAQGPGPVALKVSVLQKFGSSYNIKIEYQR